MKATPAALVSIHDVMPHTLDDVQDLLALCAAEHVPPPALLVVPGLDWPETGLEKLRAWERAGSELIAHGWEHRTTPKRVFHRLHAALFSRSAAEHLDLSKDEVLTLMTRARAWFAAHGLEPPQTYIPPAWALGIPVSHLVETTYSRVETLKGIHLIGPRVDTVPLPLLGFEADTRLRASFLRRWNALQWRRSCESRKPVRVALHPRDHHLYLRRELLAALRDAGSFLTYRDIDPLRA